MIKTILFDLDGTLLPMDQDKFTKSYFKQLSMKVAPLGYEPKSLISAIWRGMEAMVENTGTCTNEKAFWNSFEKDYGKRVFKDKHIFDDFYKVEFQNAKSDCGFNPLVKDTITEIKNMGYRTVLATNPIFPSSATESRIRWAGLEPDDFEIYTTYENSIHCKPNPEYYNDILKTIDCSADECLMVGNNVDEDMIAKTLGMKVFLITDCLINDKNEDISVYPNGSFPELLFYIKTEIKNTH